MRSWMVLLCYCSLLSVGCSGSSPTEETAQQSAPRAAEVAAPAPSEQALPTARPPAAKPAATAVAQRKPRAAGPATPLALSYVLPEHFAAIVVRPEQIAGSRLLASAGAEQWLTDFSASASVDPRDVEHLVFLIGPPDEGAAEDDPYMPAAVIRFSQPTDATAVLTSMWGEVQAAEHAGKKYYRQAIDVADPPAGFIADDRTVVIASEKALHRMLSPVQGEVPLAQRLQSTNVSSDLTAVLLAEPVRPLIQAFAGSVPQQYHGLENDLNAATLVAHLEGASLLELTLEGRDPEATTRLQQFAGESIEVLRGAYPLMLRPTLLRSMAPAVAQPLAEVLDEAMSKMTVSRDALNVKIAVQSPPKLQQLPEVLAPALASARESAAHELSLENMRSLGLAMHMHNARFQAFPGAAICDADGRPLLSWRVNLLQYLGPDEVELYGKFRLDEPWNSEHNLALVSQMPSIYAVDQTTAAAGKTSIMLFTGDGAPFSALQGPRTTDIRDGMANTLMIVRAGANQAAEWTRPADLLFDPAQPLAALGNAGEIGVLATFFDGSAEALNLPIADHELRGMITPQGSEPVARSAKPAQLNLVR